MGELTDYTGETNIVARTRSEMVAAIKYSLDERKTVIALAGTNFKVTLFGGYNSKSGIKSIMRKVAKSNSKLWGGK